MTPQFKSSSNFISITGKITIKGNEPRTWVCLTTASGVDYRLKGDLVDKIRTEYQHKTITLKGKEQEKPQNRPLPNGFEVFVIQPESP